MLRFLSLFLLSLLTLHSASAGRTRLEMFYQEQYNGPISFEVSSLAPVEHAHVDVMESVRFKRVPAPLESKLKNKIEGCHFFTSFAGYHDLSGAFLVPYVHVNQLLICVADFLNSEEGKDFEWRSVNADIILHRAGIVKPQHLNITLSPEDKVREALQEPSEEKLLSLIFDAATARHVGVDVFNALGKIVKSEEDLDRVSNAINKMVEFKNEFEFYKLKDLSEQAFNLITRLNSVSLLFQYGDPNLCDWNLVARFYEMGRSIRKLDVGDHIWHTWGRTKYQLTENGIEGICKVIKTGTVSELNTNDRGLTIKDIQRIIEVSRTIEMPRKFNFAGNPFSKKEANDFKQTLPEGFEVFLGHEDSLLD